MTVFTLPGRQRAGGLVAASLVAAASIAVVLAWSGSVRAEVHDKWCSAARLRFFVGGAEGDSFGTIVYNGGRQAERDLGPKVDYVFSAWNVERMVQQLREAIAARPDGIAMMGHPGDAALMPLAEEASRAGIRMMYQNVPVPKVIATFGGGYVGPQVAQLGRALGLEVVRRASLKSGDVAFMQGPFDMETRGARERATVAAMEEAGVKVVRINSQAGWAADPNLALPVITAALARYPEVKAVGYGGGQMLGNVPAFMRAAGKKPGEIFNFGVDTSPQVIEGFRGGWVQLAADQQPFMQGYLPILGLCQQIVYRFTALSVDTGAGFVTPDNYQEIAKLAAEGVR
ncbi:MAG: substrate-binding domain-containing protein [Alphaproteobacteria bacterium]|nr:substrate-binding domain-containing protein [Alphaproteobacteria bacterium]